MAETKIKAPNLLSSTLLMLRLANDRHLMGEHRNRRVGNVLAWGITGLIVLITAVLFAVSLS